MRSQGRRSSYFRAGGGGTRGPPSKSGTVCDRTAGEAPQAPVTPSNTRPAPTTQTDAQERGSNAVWRSKNAKSTRPGEGNSNPAGCRLLPAERRRSIRPGARRPARPGLSSRVVFEKPRVCGRTVENDHHAAGRRRSVVAADGDPQRSERDHRGGYGAENLRKTRQLATPCLCFPAGELPSS